MNKVLEHRNYKFNIKVDLNSRGEKRLGGRREHLVTVNDMGSGSYYQKYYIDSKEDLTIKILGIERETTAYIDSKLDGQKSVEETALTSLGYK